MIDLANGDAINWDMVSTSPAAVAGYPHVTVPMGYILGLPVGLSFFSKAWQEPTLIKFAYAFEQATMARVAPKYLETVRLCNYYLCFSGDVGYSDGDVLVERLRPN